MPRSRRSEKESRKRQLRKRLRRKSRMNSSLSKLALRGDECLEHARSLHESKHQRKKTRKARKEKKAKKAKIPISIDFWKLLQKKKGN